MTLYQGAGGAVFDIASPDPAQVESGALVPIEDPKPEPAPEPRKRTTPRKSTK